MEYKINDRERAALQGLSYLQRVLYYEGIRPYMDFATGLVGIKRGISYQSLAEQLYIEPHPGVRSHQPSKDQIRRALKTLARVGIIQIKSEHKKLIIQCLLASRDYCVQNKPATKPPVEGAIKNSTQALEFPTKQNNLKPKPARVKNQKAATPPVSGIINTTLSKQTENQSKVSLDFKPSKTILKKATESDCPTAHCTDELLRFITYHQSKGTVSCDWDAEYLRWLLMGKHYEKQKSKRPIRRSNKTNSAVERVLQANRDVFAANNTGRIIEHSDDYTG